MKHVRIACLIAALLCSVLCPALAQGTLEENVTVLPLSIRHRETLGPAVIPDPGDPEISLACFVRYPELLSDDPAYAPALEKINQAILEKAHIREYEAMLPAFQMGSVGLRMDYVWSAANYQHPNEGIRIYGRYLSILFSAQGKMLNGRPGQIYYPMTFDLLTGEEVAFDQLFSDPEGAKEFIEAYLEEEVEPTLSTYLENSQLFPVPYDRFFLDSLGHIAFYYEGSQLSFLSGFAGAVSFRYAELKDYLDDSDAGVIAHMGYPDTQKYMTMEQRRDNVWLLLQGKSLFASGMAVIYPGEEMTQVMIHHHAAADPDYYPGGACLELEEAEYRGWLILTDAAEEKVTGLLSSRLSLLDLETGYISLSDAVAFLGREPDLYQIIDRDDAENRRVCIGKAAIYRIQSNENEPLVFTLYADEEGTVQYAALEMEID